MKKYLTVLPFLFVMLMANAQTKHVLIEELTGTWCHYCPAGTYYLDSLVKVSPNVVAVAIHSGDQMEDSLYAISCGLSAAPSANIDRGGQGANYSSWFSTVATAANKVPSAGVEVFTQFNPGTRMLTMRVKATFSAAVSGNYRLAAIITEDGITGPSPQYNQANYYSGGASGYMGGFAMLPSSIPASIIAYNHVGRALLGGYNGQAGSVPATVPAGDTASYVFTYTLPANWRAEYIRVIGLLLRPDNTVDNAGKSLYLDGNSNAKPLFISQPITTGYVGSPYLFDVYATDPDYSNITITSINLPSWLTMSSQSALGMIHTKVTLSGTPSATGIFPVVLVVSDGSRTDTLSFAITVNPGLTGSWQLVGAQGFTDITTNLGIVADKNGVLYAFIDKSNTCNVFQMTPGGNWTNYGNLNGVGGVGRILIGSDGLTPYVAYLDPPGPVTVKKYVSGSWVQIGGSPANGVQLGFDLDASDKPYIALQDAGYSYSGNCYTYDGTSWSRVGNAAYSGTQVATMNDVVVNKANGDVYILWNNYANGKVPVVSKWNGTSWSNAGGASIAGDPVYYYQNLVINKNSQKLYVTLARSVTGGGGGLLDAYEFDGTAWTNIGSDIINGKVNYLSMAINNAGALLVSFVDLDYASSISAMSYFNGSWNYIGPRGFSNALGSKSSITSFQNMPYVLFQDGAASNKATVRYYDAPIVVDEPAITRKILSIFPNPSDAFLKVGGLSGTMEASVYNTQGTLAWRGQVGKDGMIPTSSLSNGMYILKINEFPQKFIVSHK
ncbi:MAG TPA: Omp28-related outer membrane protein [Bacteroidales bacterium]|nr:Omp28-related outer membrane protein [Bacteroidales bacterium]HRZ47967.1 Omp28-related outer membrane protein [Bacteroidales bacterium]